MINEVNAVRNGSEMQRQAIIQRMNAIKPTMYDDYTLKWYRQRKRDKNYKHNSELRNSSH